MSYEVFVGNVGSVYEGDDRQAADQTFQTYVELSKYGQGRASQEEVVLFQDGHVIEEYVPA